MRALTGAGGAQLVPKSIKGTFGSSCKVKTSDGKWELKLNDGTSTLQVALNDTFSNCPLTLTAISVQVGSQIPTVDYTVSPPIALNNAYATAPLLNPVNDARAMNDTLRKLGFTVLVAENQNRKGLSETMLAFDRMIEKGDTAFFFFAGHGFEIGGENYLLPTDVPSATVQLTCWLTSFVEPSAYLPTAANCCVVPLAIVGFLGVSDSDVSVAAVMSIWVETRWLP